MPMMANTAVDNIVAIIEGRTAQLRQSQVLPEPIPGLDANRVPQTPGN
jgi:hypothetical protein